MFKFDMYEWASTFLALFFTDIFHTYYLRSVQHNQTILASLWSVVVFVVASLAVINYTTNHWLLIPAGIGAFCGTYVGMLLRNKK